MQNGTIGRQAILNQDGTIYGYELLYRENQNSDCANVVDDNYATSNVLLNTLNTFGLDKLIGDRRAFLNVGKALLMDSVLEVIPKERFILEILEDIIVDEAVIARVKFLSSKGYSIAIDDLNFDDKMIENFEPLFKYCEILKLDLMQIDMSSLSEKVKYFKKYNLKLLAEKVETIEEFELCKKYGFDFFQGYYFSKPDLLHQEKLSPSTTMVLHILAMFQKNNNIKSIEQEFLKSPELSIQLLRYINSAFFGLRAQVISIAHAISMLGKVQMSSWLTLHIYGSSKTNQFVNPLMESAMFRAKFMNELTKLLLYDKSFQDKAYLVGMFSLVDRLLHTSFEEIFEELDFDEEFRNALLKHDGKLGTLLKLSQDIENFNDFNIEEFQKINIDENALNQALVNSYEYVNTLRTNFI